MIALRVVKIKAKKQTNFFLESFDQFRRLEGFLPSYSILSLLLIIGLDICNSKDKG